MSYKETAFGSEVLHLPTGALISAGGPGWQAYEDWLAQGNQPEPFETEAEQAQRFWSELRALRDQKLLETDWQTRRHEEQLAASLPTSLSGAQYQELLAYRQVLRDLPDQTDSPEEVQWPGLSF